MARRTEPGRLGTPADLHTTWRVLVGGAQECAEILIGIARNGRNDGHRVTAAKTVLEMAGFKTPDTINVVPTEYDQAAAPAGEGTSPAARLRSRLETLAATEAEDADVVDAVVVQVVQEDGEIIDAVIEDED